MISISRLALALHGFNPQTTDALLRLHSDQTESSQGNHAMPSRLAPLELEDIPLHDDRSEYEESSESVSSSDEESRQLGSPLACIMSGFPCLRPFLPASPHSARVNAALEIRKAARDAARIREARELAIKGIVEGQRKREERRIQEQEAIEQNPNRIIEMIEKELEKERHNAGKLRNSRQRARKHQAKNKYLFGGF